MKQGPIPSTPAIARRTLLRAVTLGTGAGIALPSAGMMENLMSSDTRSGVGDIGPKRVRRREDS